MNIHISSCLILLISFSWSFAQGPGSSLDFNGTSDYVSIPHDTSQNATTALTIEAWIYAHSWHNQSWGNVIVSKDGWSSTAQGYSLRSGNNGTLSFNIGDGVNGTSWHESVTGQVMALNTWYHVAGTYDGTVLKTYINGQLQDSTLTSATISNGTYAINIGRITYTAAGTRNFDGEIDEVRIWRASLSESTIRDWMCRKVNPKHPAYANLIGNWRMDEGTGTSTADLSPNGNNGTLTGSTWMTSSAAIGDTSAWEYVLASSMMLAHPDGDTLTVVNLAGTFTAVQVYRVSGSPNDLTLPANYSAFDTNHYWGIFPVSGPTDSFNIDYHYGGNTFYNSGNEAQAMMAARADNASAPWSDVAATVTTIQDLMETGTSGRQEIIGGIGCPTASITPANNDTFCNGDSITLSAAPGASSVQWMKNGSSIPGATTASLIISDSGSFQISILDSGCQDTSAAVAIGIYPTPAIPTIAQSGDTLIASGSPTIHWFDDNGMLPFATGPTYVPAQSANYYALAQDMNGCWSDTSNVINVTLTSVPSQSQNEWLLFPNPSSGAVRVQLSECSNCRLKIRLIDASGKIVFAKRMKVTGGQLNLDFSSISDGHYSLSGESGNRAYSGHLVLVR